jgi:hypothetical protein
MMSRQARTIPISMAIGLYLSRDMHVMVLHELRPQALHFPRVDTRRRVLPTEPSNP